MAFVPMQDGQSVPVKENHSMGWERDIPDPRDFTLDSPSVKKFKAKDYDDLVESLTIDGLMAPRPQGKLSSCTAHAATYMYESLVLKAGQGWHPLSRLFVYKTTRNLLDWRGDRGGFLRTAMQSLVMFGAPPEEHYEYDQDKYEDEPSAFLYAMGQSYQALTYYRLDPFGTKPDKIISRIKMNLTMNQPCMFGFIVFGINKKNGDIHCPIKGQRHSGGHAITAIGYDDNRKIVHPDGTVTTGAFKCANWWGVECGDQGHLWLPYWYIEKGLATDWWTMMKAEWLDLAQFGRRG